MNKCFQGCSELTVHKMAFEYLEHKTFTPGERILKANKRSQVNEVHCGGLSSQTSLIMQRILQEMRKKDKYGRVDIR